MTMSPADVTGERVIVQDEPREGTGMLDTWQFVLRDARLSQVIHFFLLGPP